MDGEGADGADDEREQRDDDGDDQAGVEGELGGGDEDQGRAERDDERHQRPHEVPGERADGRQQEDQEDVDPARCRAQRDALEHGRDRVGPDLGTRHQLAAVWGLLDVLEDRGRRTDDDDLALQQVGVDPAVEDVDEGVGRDRFRRARVVDPCPSSGGVEPFVFDEFALRRFRGGDGEAFEVLERIWKAPDGPVGVGYVDRVAGAGADPAQHRIAAEDRVLALWADFGGGEDDVAGAVHRFDQFVVFARNRGRRELDVVGDHLGAVFDQAVDQPRVEPPRERPLLFQFAEGVVVDPDDRDFRRRFAIAADREAGVDAPQFEPVQKPRRVAADADRGRDGRDGRKGENPPPGPHRLAQAEEGRFGDVAFAGRDVQRDSLDEVTDPDLTFLHFEDR